MHILKSFMAAGTALLLYSACNSNKTGHSPLTEQHISGNMYMQMPADYTIETSPGPDFTVYYFYPKDTARHMPWTGGCYFGGHPHPFGPKNDQCTTDMVQAVLPDKKAAWAVYHCDTEFTAETVVNRSETEKVHAFISASSLEATYNTIHIFESLKEK